VLVVVLAAVALALFNVTLFPIVPPVGVTFDDALLDVEPFVVVELGAEAVVKFEV